MTIALMAGRLFVGLPLKFLFIASVFYGLYFSINTAVNRSVESFNVTSNQPDGISLKERERQLACLAQNIYWEAATEPFEGKVAVAQVTINRSQSGMFPNDICKVVYQKNFLYEKTVCQFSWYCENNFKIKPVHPARYQESEAVARRVLLEGFRLDSIKEALYYHADYVNPKWNKQRVAKIGKHIFYKG